MEYWNNGMLVFNEISHFYIYRFPHQVGLSPTNHFPICPEPTIPGFHYSTIPIMSEAN
jgi:hypothetical protein